MKLNSLAAASLLGIFTLSAHAGVLVYEGFNYGDIGDGSTMDGVATNATGLTGNYALGQSLAGLGTAAYFGTGLSFGSNFLPATGGALFMSITSNILNTTRSAQLGAALDTGTVTGTVYTSYLFSLGSTGTPAGTSQMRINGAQTISSNQHFGVLADGTLVRSNSLQYGGETVKSAPTNTLALDTTYLAVAKFTNVGTVGLEGTGEMWVLTEAAYNDWYSNSGVEDDLALYAVPGSYLFTNATTTETNSAFSNNEFLSYAISNASNTSAQSMIMDETRWGSELADVIAVPEPSTVLLFSAGAFLLLRRHVRRRSA